MRINMVGHASVVIGTSAGNILCDPWLLGKAFNNSWSLRPAPVLPGELLGEVDYLWISHEHPDHFSVPTLRSFPAEFKARVTVLFQKKNSAKIFDAMRGWGYANFTALPDRTFVPLSDQCRLICYQVGMLDSALAVVDGSESVVNLNDADMPHADLLSLRKRIGAPSLLLNQFSIAGFDGYLNAAEALERSARLKLDSMLAAHRALGASFTLPFASFIYFSATDNRFINAHANSISRVARMFEAAGEELVVLRPGEVWISGSPHDNRPAVAELQAAHDSLEQASYDAPPLVALAELEAAFGRFYAGIHRHYPALLRRRIGTLRWRITDLGVTVATDFISGSFRTVADAPSADIEVCSQPLHHGFTTPFGFETLAVSGRFRVLQNRPRWRYLKIVSILNNQQVYLAVPYVFNHDTVSYLTRRLASNLLGQVRHKARLRRAVGLDSRA
jgi:UDP-MurNAc hydroxylase